MCKTIFSLCISLIDSNQLDTCKKICDYPPLIQKSEFITTFLCFWKVKEIIRIVCSIMSDLLMMWFYWHKYFLVVHDMSLLVTVELDIQ
jgi:hypothetical protein